MRFRQICAGVLILLLSMHMAFGIYIIIEVVTPWVVDGAVIDSTWLLVTIVYILVIVLALVIIGMYVPYLRGKG